MARPARSLAPALILLALVACGVAFSIRTSAHSTADVVQLAPGGVVALATPPFLAAGKRYAFTWSGGGPSQTHTVKAIRPDGWVLVEVADETTRTDLYVPGEFPERWLHVGLAISIQEMRPLP